MGEVRPLRIGHGFRMPLDAVTETFAVLGTKGSGKSSTAKRLVEQLIKAGQQVVVIDPTGVWHGLRSSPDGQSPGLPVTVLGGPRGDLPLNDSAGPLIADLVVNGSNSIVCDLSLMRKPAMRRFMLGFTEDLYRLNREPLFLVVDEADMFAGQRVAKGEMALLGAMDDIARRGRVKGIGLCAITQRPASLNKDVLSMASTLVTLRTVGSQDRQAIDQWVKANGSDEQRYEMMKSVASLPTGTAWFWSPSWLNVFRKVAVLPSETFDSMQTPKAGQRRIEPKVMTKVDIAALRDRLDAIVEEAEANDPVALRRKVADLEQKLAVSATHRPVVSEPTVVERVVEVAPAELVAAMRSRLRGFDTVLNAVVVDVAAEVGALRDGWASLVDELAEFAPAASPVADAGTPRPVSKPAGRASSAPRPSGKPADGDRPPLKAGARRILETLVRHHPMRLTTSQVGTLDKFKTSGGTFAAYKSALVAGGFVLIDGGLWEATQEGFDLSGVVPSAPMTPEEVLAQWRSVIKAGARRMLDELVAFYPAAMTRDELAERVGMAASGGTFAAYLSTLRTNGLAVVDGAEVSASPTLFIATA